MLSDLTALEILNAFANDGELADKVLAYMSQGMWDEWDCPLISDTAAQFGADEYKIAARTAALILGFKENH